MKRTMALFSLAVCLCALHAGALERITVSGNYYDSKANAWAEGTISSVGPDGRVVISGHESPYATTYTTYHKEYYALPEAEREARRHDLNAKYRDRLAYSPYRDPAREYSFSVENRDKFVIYDETPRYGTTYENWKYSTPRTYTYSDLKAGDRVVVGYDSGNPSSVYSMYRVDAGGTRVNVGADVKVK